MCKTNIYSIRALFCVIFFVAVGSCNSNKDSWNNPEKVYGLLCNCKNSKGVTVDEQWLQTLKEHKVQSSSPDEVIRAVNHNTNMLYDMLDAHFLSDENYLNEMSRANDTLKVHNSQISPEGNFEELFAVRSRFPACVSTIAYLRAQ